MLRASWRSTFFNSNGDYGTGELTFTIIELINTCGANRTIFVGCLRKT